MFSAARDIVRSRNSKVNLNTDIDILIQEADSILDRDSYEAPNEFGPANRRKHNRARMFVKRIH